MRRSTDFDSVVRSGVRSRGRRVVVHRSRDLRSGSALVGLVVSKAVGGSVVRHRVSRRLRAELARRIDAFPAGSGTVVRALPAAGQATTADFAADLDRVLPRLAEPR